MSSSPRRTPRSGADSSAGRRHQGAVLRRLRPGESHEGPSQAVSFQRLIASIFTPARTLTISFAGLILVGAFVLMLPAALVEGRPAMEFVDALFMSTSAVCVTGLATRDLGSEFTFFGQMTILVLLQVGGIGILTLSNAILFARSARVGFGTRALIEESHGILPNIAPASLLRQIALYTFAIEAVGVAILTIHFRFTYDQPLPEALWSGVFHAVSAFCNAGFSLHSDSLMRYQGDWVVNLTIITLIVLGGIGFVVFADLTNYVNRRNATPRPRLSFHSTVVMTTSLLLIALGTVVIGLLEIGGPAMPGNAGDHFLQAMFLSVTARTAGYNTCDMSLLSNATLFIVILLMFVGASPGSTGGGVKTTTLAVLHALIMSRSRNRPKVELFSRTIGHDAQAKALATVAGFFLVSLAAVIAIEVIEVPPVGIARDGAFLAHAFEVVSALCTVGLSMGITPSLEAGSKLVLIFCMFVGRVGPLLVAASFIGNVKRLDYSYPEEPLIIG